MKKTLLSLAVIAVSLSACNTTPKYTINGVVEGEQTGNVYLVKSAGEAMDTLAKAAIAEGKFVLTGTIDSLTDAYIIIEGKRGGTPIFVENVAYTATLNPASPADNKIEGTPNQALANQYAAISNEMRKGQAALYKEYSIASQGKDEEKMQQIEEQFNKLSEEAQTKEAELTKANSDSYIAAYMLASKMGSYESDVLVAKFDELGANAKISAPGKKIAERIQKVATVAVGQVAPDFTLNTPEGQPLAMHSIKAKVKVLDFWASWCGPCRGENPNVVKVYNEFHPKGLEILSISLDNDKEAWLKAIEDDKLTWNHVSDLKGWQSEAAQLYAVNGIPHVIVLDENNVIVAKNLRGEKLKEKIAEMLK
ncbi:MAG: TlpA disulfide reductase family protein [Odoribacter sp.]